jgi:cellulose synthase/poly-beta-1,6-N-acetylglucosamine synthase-like glycosyltransferase
VWRIKAIEDAGGWESDTVVEDMDLSLRCYLKGWHGVYLHDVESINELPSTLSSYKTQQYRWAALMCAGDRRPAGVVVCCTAMQSVLRQGGV